MYFFFYHTHPLPHLMRNMICTCIFLFLFVYSFVFMYVFFHRISRNERERKCTDFVRSFSSSKQGTDDLFIKVSLIVIKFSNYIFYANERTIYTARYITIWLRSANPILYKERKVLLWRHARWCNYAFCHTEVIFASQATESLTLIKTLVDSVCVSVLPIGLWEF